MTQRIYDQSRRDFFRKAAFAGLGLTLLPSIIEAKSEELTKVRLGFIGIGLRGSDHLALVLRRPDVEVTAICDIDASRIDIAQNMLKKAGRKPAQVFTGSETAYEKLLKQTDVDGVIIATPWLWHAPMAVAAMKAGKYTGLEVSAAISLQECWDLVNTHEETGVPLMILENVCYRRDIMAVLNMVRQNMFGELVYFHCGYQHDLRHVKFNDGKTVHASGAEFGEKALSEARWRTEHSVKQNADIYPTHGIGPIANYININRGNRFVSLTSSATKSRGLHNYVVAQGGEDHPNAKVDFKLGDIITTVINTANGENITLIHDTNLPRPYSLGFRVQGTKGLWMEDGNTMYLEGVSKPHEWESSLPYLEKYDHPLWKKYASLSEGASHGGMDFFVMNAFVEIIKRKAPAPLDVYDAATWSSITPLSEVSIAQSGAPQFFPDFTRGQWMKRKPVFAFGNDY